MTGLKLGFQRVESFPFKAGGTSFTCTYAEYRAGSETNTLVATWLLNSRISAVHTWCDHSGIAGVSGSVTIIPTMVSMTANIAL